MAEITTYQPDDFKTIMDCYKTAGPSIIKKIDVEKLMEAVIVLSHQLDEVNKELEEHKKNLFSHNGSSFF